MPHQEETNLGSYQLTEYASIPQMPPPPYPPPVSRYPPIYNSTLLFQTAPRAKKPIYFPLTRNASVGKQVVSIAIYSLVMTVLFAGNLISITLTSTNQQPGNVFVHPNGTVNNFLILFMSAFIFLTLPAVTLLSGAFWGAVRAFLASSLVVVAAAGVWLVYASLQHLPITINFDSPGFVTFLLVPLTAALVGFFYDRRRFAARWKSFLTLLLGSAFFVTVFLLCVVIFGHPTNTAELTSFSIGIGCAWILFIPLMALPMAGIEGMIHALIAARRSE